MQAIGEATIKHQDIQDFDDYAKLIPSLSYSSIGGGVFSGPGFAQVYMRRRQRRRRQPLGIAAERGMYLDEQPITTIQGSLDINIHDVARIEALAGPQGTLYGASSGRHGAHHHQQAGSERVRRRLFGRGQRDRGRRHRPRGPGLRQRADEPGRGDPPGRLGEIRRRLRRQHPRHRTFPTSGVTLDNAALVDENHNRARTVGARRRQVRNQRRLVGHAADHGPAPEGQRQRRLRAEASATRTAPLFPRGFGRPVDAAALTVEGKIGNFDLTYAYCTCGATSIRRPITAITTGTTSSPVTAIISSTTAGLIPPAQHINARTATPRPATNCA